MSYQRTTYVMTTYTLTVPTLDNEGLDRGHLENVRYGLLARSINSWTETPSVGYWHGKAEPGTLLTFYVPENTRPDFARILGDVGRRAMPDQEAVQVTQSQSPTTLLEA